MPLAQQMRSGVTGATETGNDLVEDEQDAVFRAQLTQALQIAHGRHQHTGAARHGLDDDGSDVAGVVQRHHAFQVFRKISAVRRLAHAVGVARRVVGVAQVVDTRHSQAVGLAVAHHATHRDAAEINAVVTAFAADEACARALAAHTVVGQGHLQRRLHGF